MKLTKIDIINAFKKSGIKPKKDCYLHLHKEEHIWYGCALTALYCVENDITPVNLRKNRELQKTLEKYINSKYGKNSYGNFIEGFDGRGRTTNKIQKVVREASIELLGE